MDDSEDTLPLDHQFRWPRRGDKPFQCSDDWRRNARMETEASSRLVMMMSGYKQAADLMVERAQQSTYARNSLVYPVIFNYRQFLELELKYLIATYGGGVGIDANWKSHDLAFLWSEFRKVLKGYDVADPDEANAVVGAIVGEFAKIDPNSYSYRYPVDVEGNPIPLTQEELDLAVLADVMAGVSGYFDGWDGYLDNLVSSGP